VRTAREPAGPRAAASLSSPATPTEGTSIMRLSQRLRSTVVGLGARLSKSRDVAAARRSIPIDAVRSVCLFLGPYRNLTTLTASLLFLHPNCQVLNHAGNRIFGDPRLDFLDRYDEETFDAFVQYAIHASRGGARGDVGGSITHSHAFDDRHVTRQLFHEAGGDLVKPHIHSLVWKESLRTSNHLRDCRTDLDAIFARNPRLRFLLPVRNPIDAAFSNRKTGHAELFKDLSTEPTVENVLDAILDEFAWVDALRGNHPDRFFVYFENDFTRQTAADMARFLELEPLDSWLDQVMTAYTIDRHYDTTPDLLDHYRTQVDRKFPPDGEFAHHLLSFVDTPAPVGSHSRSRHPRRGQLR
jgi:hypothetical protein